MPSSGIMRFRGPGQAHASLSGARPITRDDCIQIGSMRVLHNPAVPGVKSILTSSLADEVREAEFRHVLEVIGMGEEQR